MASYRGDRLAFGGPGNPPRWAPGDKDGVGTAYSAASLLWFTLSHGIVTEIYSPGIDRPQTRDLQYLFSDNESFFHDETRDLQTHTEQIGDGLVYLVTGSVPNGWYRYSKTIIADPHIPCLLQRTRVETDAKTLSKLKIY